jgi:hypothetical protein
VDRRLQVAVMQEDPAGTLEVLLDEIRGRPTISDIRVVSALALLTYAVRGNRELQSQLWNDGSVGKIIKQVRAWAVWGDTWP